MKLSVTFALLLAILSAAIPAAQVNTFTPDKIPYENAPAFLPAGAQIAFLEGDPTAATGEFTLRLKMPDGYKLPPHWHPKRENITVISGTVKFGMGDTFDAAKMAAFPAGSFAYMDPSMHHYAMASGEAVVQVHGPSPFVFHYVNAGEDPTKKR